MNLKEKNLILELDGNCCLSSRGDFIVGYKIDYPEKYSLGETDLDALHTLWCNALKNLPVGTIVAKYDIYLKDKYDTSNNKNWTFFQRTTNNHFSRRDYISHNGYIFFVFTEFATLKNSSIRNPFQFPQVPKMMKEDKKYSNFKSEIDIAENQLNRSTYIKLIPLSEKEIRDLYVFWFGGFSKDYLTDIKLNNSEILIEDKKCAIVSINNELNLPEELPSSTIEKNISCKGDYNFYKNIMDLATFDFSYNHIYSQIIFIDDHKAHLDKFFDQQSTLHGARALSYSNGIAAKQLQNYIEEIQGDYEFKYVRANNSLIFWSDDDSEFKKAKDELLSIFREQNIKPYYPTGIQLKNLFLNTFFTNVSCLDNNSLYISDLRVPITLFTNSTNYKNSDEGILFNDRMYNVPVKFDFWDRRKVNLQSRNFIIIAPTGGGKSVTNQHILRQLIEDDVKVVIADLGDSYLKFSKLLDEKNVAYYKYEEGKPIGLNPFAFEGEVDSERIDLVSEFIWTLVKREQIPSEEERTSLRKIVAQYYATCSVTNTMNMCNWGHFYSYVENNSSTLFEALDINAEYFDLNQFFHNGGEFMPGGIYHYLFHDDESPKEDYKDKKLIIFELQSIMDNRMLLNIMLLAMSHAINKTIWNDKRTKGVVFFDEFAKQLEFPSILDKVKFYAQAIRKQEGALGLILQTVNQLPQTPPAMTILDNTETFIFLNMNIKSCEDVRDRLKFTEHQMAQLASVQNNYSCATPYSEIFIKRGSIQNVYRIELPKPILYAYNTEGTIHEDMMNRYEIHKDMTQVIEEMMKEGHL